MVDLTFAAIIAGIAFLNVSILWLLRNAKFGQRRILAGAKKGQPYVPESGVYFVTPDRNTLVDARIALDDLARDLKSRNDLTKEEIRQRVLYAAARLNKVVPR